VASFSDESLRMMILLFCFLVRTGGAGVEIRGTVGGGVGVGILPTGWEDNAGDARAGFGGWILGRLGSAVATGAGEGVAGFGGRTAGCAWGTATGMGVSMVGTGGATGVAGAGSLSFPNLSLTFGTVPFSSGVATGGGAVGVGRL
jgi:hypothetical protein